MESFDHLLLTRFNVRFRDRFKETRGINPNPEWLNNRFKLFEQFCYPSVYSQSNQNFKWLVFFDRDTPDFLKNKIKEYSNWKNFIPVYTDSVFQEGEFPKEVRELLRLHMTKGSEYLITSRLDNDDAICKNYIQMVQDNFKKQEVEGINFLYGYQLYQGKLYLDFSMGNHFISLIEKYEENNEDSWKTVFCRHHSNLYEVCHVKIIKDKPTWLEVIHEENISNIDRPRGFRMPTTRLLKDFSINCEGILLQENLLAFWIERILSLIYIPYYLSVKLFKRVRYHYLQ
jgi:hypothetical protein